MAKFHSVPCIGMGVPSLTMLESYSGLQLSHWSLLQVSIQEWWVDLIQEIDSKVYSTFLYDSSLGYTVHVY